MYYAQYAHRDAHRSSCKVIVKIVQLSEICYSITNVRKGANTVYHQKKSTTNFHKKENSIY